MPTDKEKIREYWDAAAQRDPIRETVTQWPDEDDNKYWERWVEEGEYVADKIMSNCPVPRPNALEIGPGMGRITVQMLKRVRSIVALDISSEMVGRISEIMVGVPNFTAYVIDNEDLDFLPADHFELAYAIAVFQHADKKTFYRYLRGIRRALCPGGVLFFGVMDLASEHGWQHFEAIVNNDYPEFFHTREELDAYLGHAGYAKYHFEQEGETLWVIAYKAPRTMTAQ